MGSSRSGAARWRKAFVTGWAALWLLSTATGTRAQDTVVFSVSPSDLTLDRPGVVEVRLSGAPPSTGFQVELGWDPAVVAVTAVAPGEFLAGGGPTTSTPRFAGAGSLVIAEVLTGAAPSGDLPSGEGTLAYVTLAPLGAAARSELTLSGASLLGPSGEAIPATLTTGGLVTVEVPAAEPQQTAAAAQAAALAEQLGESSGSGRAGLPGLGSLALPKPGSTAIWLGLLLVALLVAALGWALGRRPPAGPDPT